MANFRHTWTVNILHISCIRRNRSDHDALTLRRRIEAAKPDLVVSTGDPGDLFAPPGIPSCADFLVLPGPDDSRETFARRFGRRYRIDDNYPYLDRTVHVMGLAILLLDATAPGPTEEQCLWMQSQLHDLGRNAVRGQILPRILVFSYRPLLTDEPTPAERILVETAHSMNFAGIAGNTVSVFSGDTGAGEESVIHREGVCQYTVPSLPENTAMRIIRIGTDASLETAVVYSNREE
jgi:hypothetical protein